MALDSELLALMVDTVTIAPLNARGGDGIVVYGPPVTYRARVESTNRKVMTNWLGDIAEERVATGRTYLPESPVVTERDRITLPDGRQPRILAVEHQSDERGPHHQIVWT